MDIIEITTIESSKRTIVYHRTYNRLYATLPSTRQQDFFDYLRIHCIPIDYAIIGFNQPYRNTLYALYPHIKICINKKEVEKLMLKTLGIDWQCYEEVAATGWTGELDIYTSSYHFIKKFYEQKDKVEAWIIYKEWVSSMPLGVPNLNRMIRVMEYYQEEIFNYIELNNKIKLKS